MTYYNKIHHNITTISKLVPNSIFWLLSTSRCLGFQIRSPLGSSRHSCATNSFDPDSVWIQSQHFMASPKLYVLASVHFKMPGMSP